MSAYIIVLRKTEIRDEAAMAEYQRRTRAMPRNPHLIPKVIYGAMESLEGNLPEGVIVMEFPSVEEARAWYQDEEYQQALPYRLKAADYDMFIVEGFDMASLA